MILGQEVQLRDFSSLDLRFIPYFKSGERVEVVWKEGYEDYTGHGSRTEGRCGRFYVSMSTGWRPIFIQLLKRNSSGGVGILTDAVEDIRGLGTYLYDNYLNAQFRREKFEAEWQKWEDQKSFLKPPVIEPCMLV